MQDVSIPYFKKRETIKEKLLREIKEELQKMRTGQNTGAINGDGGGKATAAVTAKGDGSINSMIHEGTS